MRGVRFQLSTRVLLVAAAIGAAGGVLLAVNNAVRIPLMLLYPPLFMLLAGVWFFIPVLASAFLKIPGIAFITATLAGLIALPFSGFYFVVILASVTSGVFVESVLLVSGYRGWESWRYIVAGVMTTVLVLAIHWGIFKIDQMDTWVQVMSVLFLLIGFTFWAGLGLWTAKRLRASGIVSPPRVKVG